MPIRFQKHITRKDLRDNPNVWYVFGDNYVQKGFGAQAREMRGEPNSIGIATKISPRKYFTGCDTELRAIFSDLSAVYNVLTLGDTVVWPKAGIGTGLARLNEHHPRAQTLIKTMLEMFIELFGEENDD